MTVTIELSENEAASFKAKAAPQGLTLEDWFQRLARHESAIEQPKKPFKTGYGSFAKYGPAPSAEEIEESRRDIFRGFAEDFS